MVGWVSAPAFATPPGAPRVFAVEVVLDVLSQEAVAEPGKRAGHIPPRVPVPVVTCRPVPVMPAAEFDLALLVPDNVPSGGVEAALRRTAGELLERLVLFDRFRGKGVPDGHASLAWRLTFRHPERTLNDREIAGRRQKIISTLEKELGVVPRAG
jgi:phenylalanyl-tRNA synthetase beta chain